MRTALAWLAAIALLGCGRAREPDADDLRLHGAPEVVLTQTVQVRNGCPDAVEIAVAATLPGPATPTMTVRSARTEAVTVEQGARIWLRHGGEFDESRSVLPSGPVDISDQCNSIYPEHGR